MILSTIAALGAVAALEPEYSEVVFLIDVSGSTESSQRALRGIALETASNQLVHFGEGKVRIALITFGWSHEKLVVNPFTDDPEKMVKYLAAPINGAYNAIEHGSTTAMTALKRLPWSTAPNVKRTMYLMGNEGLVQHKLDSRIDDVIQKARAVDVAINTVFTPFHSIAGSPQEYEGVAHETKGQYKYLNESDLVTYTKIYESYNRYLGLQEELQRDRQAKELYLRDLLRKKIGR